MDDARFYDSLDIGGRLAGSVKAKDVSDKWDAFKTVFEARLKAIGIEDPAIVKNKYQNGKTVAALRAALALMGALSPP